MRDQLSRREFFKAAALAGTAAATSAPLLHAPLAWAEPKSANEKLNIGIIGVAGKGASNIDGVATENIVALCDIDATRLGAASQRFPKAFTTDDYRRILDFKNLDAVVISTPDHMHAIPTAQAIRQGLAVYCEKPLTHSVFEARTIRELAAKHKVVTQMGTQIHAGSNYRRVVETIQAGVIGQVKRVHVWQSNIVPPFKRIEQEVPKGISYDLWVGPAPYRPFSVHHFHFQWRFWFDFGGGNLADMACHYIDLPYWALGLKAPTSLVATGEKAHDGDNDTPSKLKVDYYFPARGEQPPVHLTWYQGGLQPQGAEVYAKSSAVLFEGTDGRLLADYGTNKLFMQQGKEARPVKPSIPDSIGHHQEWVHAIKTGGPTTCNFEYGGTMTETALLGNVSYKTGGKLLEWDAEHLKVTNVPEANQHLHREYRQGWVL